MDDRKLGAHPGLQFVEGGQGGEADKPSTGGTDGGGLGGQAGQTVSGGTGGSGSGELGTGGDGQGGTAGIGATGGNGGSVAGRGAGGANGGSTAGGAGTGLLGPCPDLDDDGVPDCNQTLIKNAAFDADVSGWSSETNASLEWVSNDAGGVGDSGALGVSNTLEVTQDGSLMVGAHQCQPVEGATVYRFITEVSVPDEAPDTRGGFQITLFDGPKCTGTTLDTRTSMLYQGSAWQLADLTYLTPTAAKSVSLRLVSIKPFVQAPVTVLFDNVLMHAD